jgi:hypothetical protein
LFTFWLYPLADGAMIEHRVLEIPLSKDEDKLRNLRRSLAVYRLVFGQSRQEDMVEFLPRSISENQVNSICSILRLDLSPPHKVDVDAVRSSGISQPPVNAA